MKPLLLALALQTPPLPPPPLHTGSTEVTCPVGGQRFTATTTLTYSVLGRRPDGKPYSEVSFPRPLPVCPENGLVMFSTFTTEESEQLAKWIATPTYQAMRTTESPFYRAYWLATKIGRPTADAIELLLPAIWSAKDEDRDTSRRPHARRYQKVLVDAVAAAPADVSLDDRVWLQDQAANALREMGDFADAERMRARAEQALPRITRPALADYTRKLKDAIARRDDGDEPLDMIPDVEAALICEERHPKGRFSRDFCAKPEIAGIYATKRRIERDAGRPKDGTDR